MTAVIEKKITGYKVKTESEAPPTPAPPLGVHEDLVRPESLTGRTYKIKPVGIDSAFYVTINDILIDGQRHPFEMFINSKHMESYQWITALTRVASAVFRKGGEISFLAEELKAIFDPQGGYYKKGYGFVPSLVAEIGLVVEEHLKQIAEIESA